MLPLSFLRLGPVVATVFGLVVGQQPLGSFEAVRQALGLSDAQVAELQRNYPRYSRAGRERVVHFPEDMDDAHRLRLSGIATVLERAGTATMAIDIGLIRQEQWPGGAHSMCHYPFSSYYSSPYLADFGITQSQIQQLAALMRVAMEPLWPQVREKAMQRQSLLDSGVSVDSPAVVQLGSDVSSLQAQISTRPPRDLILSVLSPAQKETLAEFEKELDLAREAIELGLIYDPQLYAEVSCR